MGQGQSRARPAGRSWRPARLLTLLLALLVAAAALAGLAAGPAAAKDYTIDSVNVDAQVMPNGDLRVTDTRTLSFSGTYHFVYWDLNAKGSDGIKVTGATGPSSKDPGVSTVYAPSRIPITGTSTGEVGTYSVSDKGSVVEVQLNFEVSDVTAPFTVTYTARGAAKRWKDIAELYWQFVGDQTDRPSGNVRVTVHLPTGVTHDEVRAWAHGPLTGEVRIQPDASVVMTVDPLPAYTFVEGRILFPATALTKATHRSGAKLTAILAEEKKLADAANRTRLWARVKIGLWGILGFGVPLFALILIVILYLRYGREPKAQFEAMYLRDIPQPSLPPALVSYIWHMGGVGPNDVSATLLDLVYRKVLDLERVTVEKAGLFGKSDAVSYKLTLHDEKIDELLPYEQQLVEFLFHQIAEDSTLVLSELKTLAQQHRTAFAKGYTTWKNKVEKEAESRKYLDSAADRMAFTGAAFAFVAIVAAGAAAVFSGFWWFFAGIPVGVALIYLARAIKRRSQEAAELHAQYAALERYLKDFGRLDEKPPDAVVLWEQFLIYAVVFGIADSVAKAMTVKVPEVVNDPGFGPWYFMWYGMPDGSGLSAFNEIHQSFSQAVSVATSSSSSGSGGGGGFSGGGGGGGGGGGFGAG